MEREEKEKLLKEINRTGYVWFKSDSGINLCSDLEFFDQLNAFKAKGSTDLIFYLNEYGDKWSLDIDDLIIEDTRG